MNIGFIGAGKVGTSMGKLFSEAGISVKGYYSRSSESAKTAAEFVSASVYADISELVRECDTVFITTPDGALASTAEHLAKEPIDGKYICHCSGAETSAVLLSASASGANICSVHPLLAVSDRFTSWKSLKGAFFTLEGDNRAVEYIRGILEYLSIETAVISAEDKAKYHLSASIVSNLAVGLTDWGIKLLKECGFTGEQAKKALTPLILGNAENICLKGTKAALTGPAERGDLDTLKKHTHCLEGRDKILYALLTEKLCDIAQEKHPDRDYTALESYLEGIL